MDDLYDLLGIDDNIRKFTKIMNKQKQFNKVRLNTVQKEGYNFMADLIFLPETKKKICIYLPLPIYFRGHVILNRLKQKTPKRY